MATKNSRLTPLKEPIPLPPLEYVEEAVDFLARHDLKISRPEQRAVTEAALANYGGATTVLQAQERANDKGLSRFAYVYRALEREAIDWKTWEPPRLIIAGRPVSFCPKTNSIILADIEIPLDVLDALHAMSHKEADRGGNDEV